MGRVALLVDFAMSLEKKYLIGMSGYSVALLLPTCIESKKLALHVDNCAVNIIYHWHKTVHLLCSLCVNPNKYPVPPVRTVHMSCERESLCYVYTATVP